jgi:hypothetical protein
VWFENSKAFVLCVFTNQNEKYAMYLKIKIINAEKFLKRDAFQQEKFL